VVCAVALAWLLKAVKKPDATGVHAASVVALPLVLTYVPAGHTFVNAHTRSVVAVAAADRYWLSHRMGSSTVPLVTLAQGTLAW